MSKSSYTPEFRAKVAQEYLEGNCSRKDLSEKYNIPESTIRDWINVYKTYGINAFINAKGNKQYTKDFKIQCVEAVLKGESSVLDVARKETSPPYRQQASFNEAFFILPVLRLLRLPRQYFHRNFPVLLFPHIRLFP